MFFNVLTLKCAWKNKKKKKFFETELITSINPFCFYYEVQNIFAKIQSEK